LPSDDTYLRFTPAEQRERARAYVARVPGAVQGEGGDCRTYFVACVLINDFALPEDVALGLIKEWNLKCSPPWSDSELLDKLRSADAYAVGEPGSKLDAIAPRRTWFRKPEDALHNLIHAARNREPSDLIGWLLSESVDLLPWRRRPGKRRAPDPAKVPRKHRSAALLAAVDAYLSAADPPGAQERIHWIQEQAAREHFACHPNPNAARDEKVWSPARLERYAGGQEPREGPPARPPPPSPWGSSGERAALMRPDQLCECEEEQERFRETLSPLERCVVDEPFSDSVDDVAARIGGTVTGNSVRTARQRIRGKARQYGEQSETEAINGPSIRVRRDRSNGGRGDLVSHRDRNWKPDAELKANARRMTQDEIRDGAAGYSRGFYRFREEADRHLLDLHGPEWMASPRPENRWQGPEGRRLVAAEQAEREASRAARVAALGPGPVEIVALRFGAPGEEPEATIEGWFSAEGAIARLDQLRAERAPGDPIIHGIRRARVVPLAANGPQGEGAAAGGERVAA
jgi:hypothetical protein